MLRGERCWRQKKQEEGDQGEHIIQGSEETNKPKGQTDRIQITASANTPPQERWRSKPELRKHNLLFSLERRGSDLSEVNLINRY